MSDIKDYEPLWGSWYVESLIGEGAFGKVYNTLLRWVFLVNLHEFME